MTTLRSLLVGTSSWVVALVCSLAVVAGALTPLGSMRALAAPPHSPTAGKPNARTEPVVHGLAPLPGGARVPLHDRPPGAFAGEDGPSPVIFPRQSLPLRFNHKKHVKELKVSCTTCHVAAKTSRKSADSLLPAGTRCDGCHQTDHRALDDVKADPDELIAQCGFCHVGYQPTAERTIARVSIPQPNLIFDHALHASRNIGCAQCHGAVENVELATRDQLPRMRGCFDCHQKTGPAQGKARGECTTCHVTERGRMKTQFASGSLVPPRWLHHSEHGPDWLERHKLVAGANSSFCASCHTEDECMECHDGRVKDRRVHPNDWLNLHAIAARQNESNCSSCHRQQSFCLSCHQRVGVTMSGPYAAFRERGRFHPPPAVWTDPPRTSEHHAWEAERNLMACVSCHVERDCVICHATARAGGWGGSAGPGAAVNPHPSGFRSRCSTALRGNARPCLVCHDPADGKLLECR